MLMNITFGWLIHCSLNAMPQFCMHVCSKWG